MKAAPFNPIMHTQHKGSICSVGSSHVFHEHALSPEVSVKLSTSNSSLSDKKMLRGSRGPLSLASSDESLLAIAVIVVDNNDLLAASVSIS